jgi:hypothetical protein
LAGKDNVGGFLEGPRFMGRCKKKKKSRKRSVGKRYCKAMNGVDDTDSGASDMSKMRGTSYMAFGCHAIARTSKDSLNEVLE